MAVLILVLVVLNIVAGEFSITGQRLRMSSHPAFVRIRFLGFGMVAALFLVGHSFLASDWLSWASVLLLAVGVARFPQKHQELIDDQTANKSVQPTAGRSAPSGG
ncbi:MAG: hypothetical protein FJ279_08730 [Planctomycetes bacterium]|nr:hypothetical protein [Planctomycetota bacterium]MBM4085121.1 hypothetical protein [Planctomycetota bacterium]